MTARRFYPHRSARPIVMRPSDWETWRTLVARAERLADPARPLDPIPAARAGERAFKAVFPEGHRHQGNDFSLLAGLCRGLPAMGEAEQLRQRAWLGELAARCRRHLDGPGAERRASRPTKDHQTPAEEAPPPRRYRADVDG